MKTKIDKTINIKYEFEHYKCLDVNYKQKMHYPL